VTAIIVNYSRFSRSILEVEEENYSEKSESSSKISNLLTVRHTENTLHFKYDFTTINRIDERRDSEFTYKVNLEQRQADEDSLLAFCPIEIYERNMLRNMQQQQQNEPCSSSSAFFRVPPTRDDNTMVSNSLQIPIISLSAMEKPLAIENVYMSDNMTIIDTDAPVCCCQSGNFPCF
jgi:hypothetical protein